ncbi:MAG: recombinase RecA [Anaerolineales bacterium]|nr:recombinase RecA [Anaerolineales bacterium]
MTDGQGVAKKRQALDAAIRDLTKRFGEGTVMRLGDAEHLALATIPSGALSLDVALGVGGYPRGRITEIYGAESSGKTTLCLHAIAEAQKEGGVCAFVDMEHALDARYAAGVGVNLNRLYLTQPDSGEDALTISETLIRSGAFDVLILDSLAALVPAAEIAGEMGENHVGAQARLVGQALRKLTGAIHASGTVVIITNQLREKIGVLYGNPETTTGGRALPFYASLRLEVRRVAPLKMGLDDIGSRVSVRVTKSKVAPPLREAEFDIMFGRGISRSGDMIDLGVRVGIIERRGAFYQFGGQALGQGREFVKRHLDNHPQTLEALENAIRARFGL